jgi:hypothetical protein
VLKSYCDCISNSKTLMLDELKVYTNRTDARLGVALVRPRATDAVVRPVAKKILYTRHLAVADDEDHGLPE